ncbi:MAG: transglycosylase SLT domain-containing protein [Betaproteobacteria bacterium]
MIRAAATQYPRHLERLVAVLAELPPVPPEVPMNPQTPTSKSWLAAAARAYAALRSGCALVGLAALAGASILLVQRGAAWPAFALPVDVLFAPSVVAEGQIRASAAESRVEREQRAVTEFISKRYRVAEQAIAGFVSAAYRAGAEHSVDPLLILAVMAVESRYNPIAESVMGAKGLMQIMPRFHLDKLLDHGGEPALLDPEVNITVGAQILREYQRRVGDLEAALQMYAGAFDEAGGQYSAKVLAEKARLEVLRAKARRQNAQAV